MTILLEIRHNTNPPVVRCYATDVSMFSTTKETCINTSTTLVTTMSTPNRSIDSPEITSTKKKAPLNDSNTCRKCFVQYGSATDNKYDSVWINCSNRRCDHWVHAYCVGLVIRERKGNYFDKLVKYYCSTHNPNQLPRGKSVHKK